MSKISLTPNASGTGTFTITSPNSNTNRTLTLPDADGALLTADGDGSGLTGVASTPAGTLIYFAASTPPTGFLKANGAAVSRTTYADLFAVIGTTWGAGDGGTTFNLPDLRGEFVRAWDDARGIDSGRSFGSAQGSANLAHRHNTTIDGVASTGRSQQSQTNLTSYHTADGGYESYYARGTSSSVEATGSVSSTSGGTESRPRNIALLACIKY